ncbi:MAG TPA: efflux RND transporter periplasmic adaptor subunit [Thermoanaerobaculia bacterium]|nr:efflux RND transporter periplasmic adaptor subunit [Thermoanaerobaculia bacterium]
MSESSEASNGSSPLRRRKVWLIAGGIVILIGALSIPFLRRKESVQYLASKVLQGEIRDAVEATGIVNAVVSVQVGSQVSGRVGKLNVDFNSRVRQGDVIALIDPQLFQGALQQAQADLENAKANVIAAKASLTKANANLIQTRADFDRARSLAEKKVGTEQALDQAKANYDAARANVDAAAASIAQANAQVSQKEAAVAVARTNLAYTVIRSPIDGTVVARSVDVGQTVAASLQAPTIFTIAQDLAKMLVYAKVDESDVGRIRPGQTVTFKVDAFPKQLFTGTVSQLRMNATTVQNVVTYDAIITFANPELKLFPGMTAYVTIPVATVENAVKLPNAALRFQPPLPPAEVRALYAQYGIDDSKMGIDAAVEGSGAAAAANRGSGSRNALHDSAVVWKLHADGTIEPVEIALGITDHAYTEVTKVFVGALKPGDDVMTTSVSSKSGPPGGIRR